MRRSLVRVEDVLPRVCRHAGLDPASARPLRHHSNAVFLLPNVPAVARIGSGAEAVERAHRAVTITRWLAERSFSTVEPLHVDQPVYIDGKAATFWRYVPTVPDQVATADVLGNLLRELHAIRDVPPVQLPPVRPLVRLLAAVETSPVLDEDDRAWLLHRGHELLDQYEHLDFPLGVSGLVHGDAQVVNVLPATDGRKLLADWDSVAIGPREWDLVVTATEDRFGMLADERAAFAMAYGFDVTTWPEWTVLRDLRELHAVGAHIRRAPDSPPHAAEMRWRIESLRAGDRRRWHGVG